MFRDPAVFHQIGRLVNSEVKLASQKYWSVAHVQWFLNKLFKNHCTHTTLQYICQWLANIYFSINKSTVYARCCHLMNQWLITEQVKHENWYNKITYQWLLFSYKCCKEESVCLTHEDWKRERGVVVFDKACIPFILCLSMYT